MNYLVEVEKAKEAKGGSGRGRESEGGVEGESVGENEALGRDEGTGEEGSEGGVEGRDGGGGNGNGNGRGEGERDRGGDRGNEEGRGRDRNLRPIVGISKLTKMSYAVTAQTTASAIALHVGGQSSLTKVLLVCVVICNLLGFICCMTAVLLNYRRPRVAGILGGIGSISAALGFILLIVVFIPESLV